MARVAFDTPYSFSQISKIIPLIECSDDSVSFTGLCNDSRECKEGDLFIALSGSKKDGGDFCSQAIEKGASGVLISHGDSSALAKGVAFASVESTKSILSYLASALLGHPSSKLTVIGVTGTNGKTTTAWMVQHLLESLGIRTLRLGTIGAEIKGLFLNDFGLTTPDPIQLQSLISEALRCGARAVVMEVSSHALDQHRVDGVQFDGVVFTNLSRDHLDYHKTFDDYFNAKAKLFSLLGQSVKPLKISVIAGTDVWSEKAFLSSRERIQNTVKIVGVEGIISSIKGSSFSYKNEKFSIPYVGEYNIENYLCAYEVLKNLGFSVSCSPDIPPVPGRLEQVASGIFVDYAHTPDALETVLVTLKGLCQGELIVIFGCGGDRDRGKRKIMGEIASRIAHMTIITSDNPRTEAPQAIIEEIAAGAFGSFEKILDRRKAIQRGVELKGERDILLVAGKGHEEYQIIGSEKKHFSDREEVLAALKLG